MAEPGKKNSSVKSNIILIILTFVSRLAGLVRDMIRGAYMGTNSLADAFTVSYTIPNLLRRLFAENSVSSAFVPTFKGYLFKDDREEINFFLSAVFTALCVLVGSVVILGIVLSPVFVRVFPGNYDAILGLTQIMFPFLFLVSLAALFQGVLNSIHVFGPSGFVSTLLNLSMILATIFLTPVMGNPATAMAIGVILGGILQVLFQWPYIHKAGYRIRFVSLKKAFTHPGVINIGKLIAPTILGMAAYQLNEAVCVFLATQSDTGIATALNYSLRLLEFILGIFAVSMGTVLLPDLSNFVKKNDWSSFKATLTANINVLSLITIPVIFIALLTRVEIIRLIFEWGHFTMDSVLLTASIFAFHIVGLLFIALNRILAPAFYAMQDPKTPTIAGVISFTVNIILAIVLSRFFKGNGIAFALSISSFLNTILLFVFLSGKKHAFDFAGIRSILLYIAKIALFSAIASFPAWLFKDYVFGVFAAHSSKFISVGVPFVLTCLIYAAVGLILLFVTRDRYLLKIMGMVFKGRRKR